MDNKNANQHAETAEVPRKHYVLDNDTPYLEPEEARWLWWMAHGNPPLATTTVGDATVVTRFNGIDNSSSPATNDSNGQPMLFETRLEGGDSHGLKRFSWNMEEALQRHARVVQRLEERAKKPKNAGKPGFLREPNLYSDPEFHRACQEAAAAASQWNKSNPTKNYLDRLRNDLTYECARETVMRGEKWHPSSVGYPTLIEFEKAKRLVEAFRAELDPLEHTGMLGKRANCAILDEYYQQPATLKPTRDRQFGENDRDYAARIAGYRRDGIKFV
jgi:hypothetical protein